MSEFIYRAAELGYHCSTFQLMDIIGDVPTSPRVGDFDTLNNMLNIVANGSTITIRPAKDKE